MTPESEKFLADIGGNDVEARYRAWRSAGNADPEVIPQLGKMLVGSEPGVRRAADEALKLMVHSVGKETSGAKRAAVVRQLIALTADGHPAWVRTIALRRLSLIGGDETVPAAARLLTNPELQEEAVFCLERIPGRASTEALMAAEPRVSNAFKPRILAALGHRRADEAINLCATAIGSSDLAIEIAGMKAAARIGRKPTVEVKHPDNQTLSGWQKIEFDDSILRYADRRAERGDASDAVHLYRDYLNRPEEHLQCAAIIGLSKTNTAEAASLIYPKLKSENRTVRITARKAWEAMGKAG